MREFQVTSPEAITTRRGRANARDNWRLFESMGELAGAPFVGRSPSSGSGRKQWQGGSESEARAWARNGKGSLVAPSDKIMTEIEQAAEAIESPSRRTIDDVAGFVPNVPAFIAGLPCAMRRVIRETSNHTPLAILCDGTISAALSKQTIEARGAAVLALVRLLSARRAVEIWSGVASDYHTTGASFVFTRLDSSPLDTARAAYMLCDTSATRLLGYGQARGFTGAWPYSGDNLTVSEFTACARQAFDGRELLCIPGAHVDDKLTKAPVQWVLDKLRQYGERLDD